MPATEQTVTEEVAFEQAAIDDVGLEDSVVEEVPAEESVAHEAVVEEIPAEEIAALEAVVEEVPVEEFAAHEAVVEEVPTGQEISDVAASEEPVVEEIISEEIAPEPVPAELAIVESLDREAEHPEEPAPESVPEPVAEEIIPALLSEVELPEDSVPEETTPAGAAAEDVAPLEFGEAIAPLDESPALDVAAAPDKPRKRRGWFGWGKRREEEPASKPGHDRPRMADQFAEPKVLDETVDLPLDLSIDSGTETPDSETVANGLTDEGVDPFSDPSTYTTSSSRFMPFAGELQASDEANEVQAVAPEHAVESEQFTELPFEEEMSVEAPLVEPPTSAEATANDVEPELEWELPTDEAIAEAVEVPSVPVVAEIIESETYGQETSELETDNDEVEEVIAETPAEPEAIEESEPEAELFFGDETLDEIIHVEDHRDPELLEFNQPPQVQTAVMQQDAPASPPGVEATVEQSAQHPAESATTHQTDPAETESGTATAITSAAALTLAAAAFETVTHTAESTEPVAFAPTAEAEIQAPATEDFEVVEPTEPTLESALPLEIVDENLLDESVSDVATSPELIHSADLGLSDTSFGRQVEEFSGEAIAAPILDAPVADEIHATEEHVVEDRFTESLPAEELETESQPTTDAWVEKVEDVEAEMPTAEISESQPPLDSSSGEGVFETLEAPQAEAPELVPAESLSSEPIDEFIPSEEFTEPTEVVSATEGLDSPSSVEIFEAVADTLPLTAEVPVKADAQPIFVPPQITGDDTLPEFDDLEIGEHFLTYPTAEVPTEPQVEAEPDSYEPMHIPGMALFENRANIPDFIGGMPLFLNELPPPPPTFGRVQVSFGQNEPTTPLLDDPHEPSPFDRINSNESKLLGAIAYDDEDIAPMEIDIPMEPEAETAPESEIESDFEFEPHSEYEPESQSEFEAVTEVEEVAAAAELPTVEVEPVAETITEPAAEAPTIVEEPPATPVEQAVEQPVDETPPEPPVRTLFQKKLNVPPVRRTKPPETPQGFNNAPAGFGQVNVFGGLNASPRDADPFSQGLSADLSSDPVFGGTVKPLPQPTAESSQSTRGKLREPRKPAAPSAADIAETLAEGSAELSSAAIAPKTGLPARSLMRAPGTSGTPQSEKALKTHAPARPRNGFSTAGVSTAMTLTDASAHLPLLRIPGQPARPNRGRRVGILLCTMLILMIATFAAIYTFMKQRVTVTGSISFENYGKLTIAEQRNLQSQQNTLMVSEELRTVAFNNFTHYNPQLSAGYLADRLDFAKNEVGSRVKWLPTGTLVYTYEGTDKSDAERVLAVLKGLRALDADLISKASNNRQTITNLRDTLDKKLKELETKKVLRDQAQKIVERQPADAEIKALTADKEAAEKVWKQAVSAVNIADLELQRIEQASSLASTAEGTDAIGATPKPASTGDPELDRLQNNLEQANARLNIARNTAAEKAESARNALDSALEQFQQSTTVVQGIMKDNPELSAFVVAAQRLQETLQRLSGDLLDRQQKSYDHLLEEKRYLDERLASRRKELWDADKDIKRLKDDLGMRERGYNAALTNDYPKEATEIKKQMDLSLGKIEQRRMEIENDPILITLNEFTAKRQQEITASKKLLEADRRKADELTKEIEKNLSIHAPTVEKLPENQRALAQQMSSKMDAVSNARKVYAEALEEKNAEVNKALKLAEEQVQLNAAKLEERKKAVASMNTQKMTVAELQERETFVEQKRIAFDSLKKRETDAYNVYFEKEKAARMAAAEVASASKTNVEVGQLTDAFFNLRDKEIPTLTRQLEMIERDTGAFAFPSEPKVNEPTAAADQRLIYSLGAMAAIALVFSLLFALTGGRDPRGHYGAPQEIEMFAPPENDIDPLSGVGLLNPESFHAHGEGDIPKKKSAVA